MMMNEAIKHTCTLIAGCVSTKERENENGLVSSDTDLIQLGVIYRWLDAILKPLNTLHKYIKHSSDHRQHKLN